MAKKKTPTKKTKKEQDGCGFSLEGQVYVWEVKNGKRTEKPLDSEVVLNCLIYILEKSLESYKTE